MPFFVPIIISINAAASMMCCYIPFGWAIGLLCLALLVHLIMVVYIFYSRPYQVKFANEIHASKHLSCSVLIIFTIAFYIQRNTYTHIIIGVSPIIIIIIFILNHIIFKKFGNTNAIILSQIDSLDQNSLTDENIGSILQRLTSEHDFQIFFKDGIGVWNKNVLTTQVLRYCLKQCPKSTWFTSVTVYLYALVFEGSNDVYQFFLHLLSAGGLPFSVDFLVFQYVFKWMGTAYPTSPMISEGLDKYRRLKSDFAYWNMKFWESIVKTDSKKSYEYTKALFAAFSSMKVEIDRMKALYPFSPEVAAEASIFETDMAHNYPEAARFYRRAEGLLNDRRFIADELLRQYCVILPIPRIFDTEPDEEFHRVLSMDTANQDMMRQNTTLHMHDEYLDSHMCTYTVPKKAPRLTAFFDVCSFIFYGLSLLYLLLVILFVHVSGYVYIARYDSLITEYGSFASHINTVINFRNTINSIQYSVHMIQFVIDNFDRETSIPPDKFLKFVWDSITKAEAELFKMKNAMFESLSSKTVDISELGIEFGKYFSTFHNALVYYNVTQVTENGEERDEMLSKLDEAVKNMDNYTMLIYSIYANDQYNSALNNRKNLTKSLINMIALIILLPIIGLILFITSLSHIRSNIFAIMRLIQPPVSLSLAKRFEGLIRPDQITRYNHEKFSYPAASPFIIVAIIILLIYPVSQLVYIYKQDKEWEDIIILPAMVKPNNTSAFSFMVYAVMEFQTNLTVANFSRKFLDVDLALPNGVFLLLTQTAVDEDMNAAIYNDWNMDNAIFHQTICSMVSAVFVVIAIHQILGEISVIKASVELLRFIPIKAAMLSPVIQTLLSGKSLTKKIKDGFEEDIAFVPDQFGFFCVIDFDDEGNVSKVHGDMTTFIGREVRTKSELQSVLLQDADPDIVKDINRFFSIASDPIVVPTSEMELLLSSSNNSITIIDDTCHAQRNAQKRSVRRMERAMDALVSVKASDNEPVAFIIVMHGDDDALERAVAAVPKLDVVEGRFRHVVLVVPMSGGGPERVDMAVEAMQRAVPDLRIAVNASRALSELPPRGSPRPRLCTPELSELLSMCVSCRPGSVVYSESYLEERKTQDA